MNINEFKQSVLTKWSQHSTEGLEGGVARRRTPLVYQLVDEICRQVNKDFEQHQSEERRSGLLETFDLWVGWTNLAVEDWTFLHMKVRHEGLAQAVIWMSGQLDEARTHTPITDPAPPQRVRPRGCLPCPGCDRIHGESQANQLGPQHCLKWA